MQFFRSVNHRKAPYYLPIDSSYYYVRGISQKSEWEACCGARSRKSSIPRRGRGNRRALQFRAPGEMFEGRAVLRRAGNPYPRILGDYTEADDTCRPAA